MNERLINEVALGVVFVHGPGEYLAITADERLDVAADIQEGCSLLTSLEPDAEISWTTRYEEVTLSQPIFPPRPGRGCRPASTWAASTPPSREENRRSYLFQGDQYLRLSGSTMEGSYPKFIAAGWQGLPTAFASGIDAAFWRQSDGKIYLFRGFQYVRLTGTTTDAGSPELSPTTGTACPTSSSATSTPPSCIRPTAGSTCSRATRWSGCPTTPSTPGLEEDRRGVRRHPRGVRQRDHGSLWQGQLHATVPPRRPEQPQHLRPVHRHHADGRPVPKYVGGLAASETEALWRDPALAALGFGPGQGGYQAYVDEQMADAGATRGFVTFITKYPTSRCAGAAEDHAMRLRVGETSRDRVSFAADRPSSSPDEYASSNCECGKRSGRFFSVANGNCRLCANPAMDEGQPEPIASEWIGLPANFQSGIEAAVWRYDNGRAYLFKGNNYVR